MIAQLLKTQPELRDSLVGSLREKLDCEIFTDAIINFAEQNDLDKGITGLLSTMDHKRMMIYVKAGLDAADQKLVDENEEWFKQLRSKMREEYTRIKTEEREVAAEEEAEAEAEAPAPAPTPTK